MQQESTQRVFKKLSPNVPAVCVVSVAGELVNKEADVSLKTQLFLTGVQTKPQFLFLKQGLRQQQKSNYYTLRL